MRYLTYVNRNNILEKVTAVQIYLMSGKNRLFKSGKTIWLR